MKFRGIRVIPEVLGLTEEEILALEKYNRFEFIRDSIDNKIRQELPQNEILAVLEFYSANKTLFNFSKIEGDVENEGSSNTTN